jgi:PAS domain S-box-containing protein
MDPHPTYDPAALTGAPASHYDHRQLQHLFMQAPAAIALLEGPQHVYTFANPLYQTVSNRSEEQLIGKPLREVFPELEGQGIFELFEQVYHTGEAYTASEFPAIIRKKDKWEKGFYNFVIQPILNEAGAVANLMVHAYEVTSQVTAHRQTEESEARFRSIFETAGVSIWEEDFSAVKREIDALKEAGVTDFEVYFREHPAFVEKCLGLVRVTDVNEASVQLFEAPNKEALLGNLPAIFPPESISVFMGELLALAEERTSFESECRLNTLTGRQVYVVFTMKLPAPGQSFDRVLFTLLDISARKAAEEKIKESEAKFRSVIQDAPVAISLFVGTDLLIQDPNQAFIDIIGKGWSIVGKPLRDALPELTTERQPYLQLLHEVLATGQPYRTSGALVKILQQGVMTQRYYNFTYSPLFNEEGKAWAVLNIAIDVTEGINAQQAIEESEARFRNILEQTPEPMLVLKGEDLVVEVANDPLFRTWRMDKSVLGKPLLECLPELKGQGIIEMMLDVYRNRKVLKGYDHPVVYDRGNGVLETLYYNFVYSPYVEANGEVTGILIIGTDVTGSVLARQALEKSERQFRTLATTIPQIVWTTDEHARLDYLSSQWEAYTGQPLEEGLTGNYLMIHPDDLPKLINGWKEAVEKGVEWKLDYRIRNQHTGVYRWFTGQTAPLRDSEGQIIKWIGTATDIHEQKLFTEKLEALVEERTRALQRSNEDLQQFAHVASHDLKEPVRKVKTFINRLEEHLDGKLDEAAMKYVGRIHSAADRMATMIDGVLKYSTVNAATEASQPVDLDQVLKAIESDLEVIIQSTGTRIYYHNLPTVEGAPILLYQLLYNLVNNSIKFAKAGVSPQITLRSQLIGEGEEQLVRIVLNDNGIGFAEDQALSIFDTFTRLHPKDKYEGTGLGLALCKKIVERHGGRISATGIPGIGASFTILLPLKQQRRTTNEG